MELARGAPCRRASATHDKCSRAAHEVPWNRTTRSRRPAGTFSVDETPVARPARRPRLVPFKRLLKRLGKQAVPEISRFPSNRYSRYCERLGGRLRGKLPYKCSTYKCSRIGRGEGLFEARERGSESETAIEREERSAMLLFDYFSGLKKREEYGGGRNTEEGGLRRRLLGGGGGESVDSKAEVRPFWREEYAGESTGGRHLRQCATMECRP